MLTFFGLTHSVPADIDLRGYHNNGGSVSITVTHGNLTVERVGN